MADQHVQIPPYVAPLPPDEDARLAALLACDVLDTPPELAFDNIVALAARLTGTPMALVNLVDRARQWFKARVGVEPTETPRELAFCAHAILRREPLIVGDAHTDGRFATNPLVLGPPHVRFYAGVPLVSRDGFALGTLCVLDREPRQLTPQQLEGLQALARQVVIELELRRRNRELEERLPDPTAIADLAAAQQQKDELAQLIVHDLKNPLMIILGNASYIADRRGLPEGDRRALRDVITAAESLQRMIMNLLDVGRAEHGVLLPRPRPVDLAETVRSAVRTASGRNDARDRRITANLGAEVGGEPLVVEADVDLIQRILENLIDNACKYTPAGGAIEVGASARGDGWLELWVADEGPGIPDNFKTRVFDKYARVARDAGSDRTSCGLGLAFCRLAAEAHGGRIWVEDRRTGGSLFRLRLPLVPAEGG